MIDAIDTFVVQCGSGIPWLKVRMFLSKEKRELIMQVSNPDYQDDSTIILPPDAKEVTEPVYIHTGDTLGVDERPRNQFRDTVRIL